MAIYHFDVKIKTEKDILKTSAYISGEKIKHSEGGVSHYSRNEEFVYSKILLPQGCNKKFEDRGYLWNTARNNQRKNAQVARSIIVALPRELNLEQQTALMEEFCKKCFCSQGHIVDFSIHCDNKENPHAHILVTMRKINENGNLGERNLNFNTKAALINWRDEWERICNSYLDKYSPDTKHISCKSNNDLGVETPPTKHFGPKKWNLKKREENKDDLEESLSYSPKM